MINHIAVLGAGTMGHAIAANFAMYGYPVNLYEVTDEIRETVMDKIEKILLFFYENEMITQSQFDVGMAGIKIFDDLEACVKNADYVLEAVPEKIELKQSIFKQIDHYCPTHTIFATNTSSLALKEMLEVVTEERQKRMMVCHWYNPAHLMPIAELSCFGNMPNEIYKEVVDLYEKIEKKVVKVLKDVPGLVANRIQQGVAREVFSLIEMGVAEPEDIDIALKFGPAFRYATTGQLEVADMGGLDIWCTVGDNLLSVMDNRKEANPLLRQKVAEGKLGLKTGEGFFKYSESEKASIQEEFSKRLLNQLKASKKY